MATLPPSLFTEAALKTHVETMRNAGHLESSKTAESPKHPVDVTISDAPLAADGANGKYSLHKSEINGYYYYQGIEGNIIQMYITYNADGNRWEIHSNMPTQSERKVGLVAYIACDIADAKKTYLGSVSGKKDWYVPTTPGGLADKPDPNMVATVHVGGESPVAASDSSTVAAPAASASVPTSPPVVVTAPSESDMKQILKSTDTEYTTITGKLTSLSSVTPIVDIQQFNKELDSAKTNLKGAQDKLYAFIKDQVKAETEPTVTKKYNVVVPPTVITEYNDFMKILTDATVKDESTVTAGLKVDYANFAQTVAGAFNNAVTGSGSTSAELKASLTSSGACIIIADRIDKALNTDITSALSVNKFLAFIKSNSLKSEADKLDAASPPDAASPDAASPPHARNTSNITIDPKLYLSVIAALAYKDILPIIQNYLETNKQAALFIQASSSPASPASSAATPATPASSAATPATPVSSAATPATPQNLTIPTLEKFIEQINAIFLDYGGSNNEKHGLTALIAKKYNSQSGGGGPSSSSAKSKKNRKSHKSYHPKIGKTRKHHSHSEPKRISFVHQA